jgi:hypothetical protein
VFTCPEIALSSNFREKVIDQQAFKDQLMCLAIDEVHLSAQWNGFRPYYGALKVLRARIGMHVPCIGLSATLPKDVLTKAMECCGFYKNVAIQRHSIDRPNVFIDIQQLKYTMASMKDLLWFLPQQYRRPQDIPKTIIYMPVITDIRKALPIFHEYMRRLNYPESSMKLIRPYFSWMADFDKQATALAFRQLDEECNLARVLIATDAYGLGVDNPDVRLVVQWLAPDSMCSLWQRMGRAMRRSTLGVGRVLLLHQTWCKKPDAVSDTQSNPLSKPLSSLRNQINVYPESPGGDAPKRRTRKPKGAPTKRQIALDEDKRSRLDPEVLSFLNIGRCYRRHALDGFDDNTYTGQTARSLPKKCCTQCNPNEHEDRTIVEHTASIAKDTHLYPLFIDDLKIWRDSKAREIQGSACQFLVPSGSLVPDEFLEKVAMNGRAITDIRTLRIWGGGSTTMEAHVGEIVEILDKHRNKTLDEDRDVYVRWEQYCAAMPKNKGKRFAPSVPELTAREKRIKMHREGKQAFLIKYGEPTSNRKHSRKAKGTTKGGGPSPNQGSVDTIAYLLSSEAGTEAGRKATSTQPDPNTPRVDIRQDWRTSSQNSLQPLGDSSLQSPFTADNLISTDRTPLADITVSSINVSPMSRLQRSSARRKANR